MHVRFVIIRFRTSRLLFVQVARHQLDFEVITCILATSKRKSYFRPLNCFENHENKYRYMKETKNFNRSIKHVTLIV